MTLTTTLNRIRAHGPCREGWEKLLTGLGKTAADDEPLAFSRIAEINGLSDAVWCCRAEPQHWQTWQRFAVWCARQVQHLMRDPRSTAALDVAERHVRGDATSEEMAAARDAAWATAWAAAGAARDAAASAAGAAARDAAASAAWVAARDAAWATAWAAAGAARDAAASAAWDAARATSWAAAGAAWDAAWAAAEDAAWDAARATAWAAARAARDAAWAAQQSRFIEMVDAAEDHES